MIGRLDRGRRAGPHLEWKVRAFTLAAVLALVGIYSDEAWMTGLAIVVLVAGMSVRFLPGGLGGGGDPQVADGDADGSAEGDPHTRA